MGLFEEDFEEIFSTMMGNRQTRAAVPWVENSVQGKSAVAKAYENFWTARKHLCERFGLDWDDDDLELFMDGIMELEREVAQRMFLYGIGYAQRGYKI